MIQWPLGLLPFGWHYIKSTQGGYTIIEVMIAMAVTAGLFVSVAILLGGKQLEAQFEQAVRTYEAQIQNVMSETANGYYGTSFSCAASGSSRPTETGSNDLGTSKGCVFAGKFMDPNGLNTNVITVLGRQFAPGSNSVLSSSIAESLPTPASDSNDQVLHHTFRLDIKRLVNSSNSSELSSFGFFLPTSGGAAGINETSSNIGLLLYGTSGGNAASSRGQVASSIQDPSNLLPLQNGLEICAEFDKEHVAQIRIGENNSQTSIITTKSTTFTGGCTGA